MPSTHNHAAGIGAYTPSGMTNPGCQTPEMHLGKLLESEFQNVSVFESEKSSSRYPVDQRNRISQIN